MLKKKTLIFIAFLIGISAIQFSATAQKGTAKATIQPVEIAIGQQSTISLEVIAPKGRNIVFPVYNDTLVSGIEVLAMPKADTVYAHEVMTITQKYIVTSFDSALYHVPYMPVIDGTDTIISNGFGLKVMSPVLSEVTKSYLEHLNQNPNDSVDIEKLGIADIKAVQDPPFVWQDYILYGLAILALLLAIAGIIIGIYMYKKKKDTGYFFKPKVIQPPHIIALNALSQVKDEKLWQQGREKEYFTELTDILRSYIEKRFYVNAFEMTSDEILSMVKNLIETESSYESLNQILKLADLVKFAKYKPLPDENDLSMVNSILFVNQTKREEPELIPDNLKIQVDANSKQEEEQEAPIDWTIPDEQIEKDDKVNTNNKTEN